MSKVVYNSTALNKQTSRVWATKLFVPNTTLQVIFRLVLMSFLIFVVFKILLNLVSRKIF